VLVWIANLDYAATAADAPPDTSIQGNAGRYLLMGIGCLGGLLLLVG
jgi:hypothetical protein